MVKFYGYKKCGTSKKAEKFLKDKNIDYKFIDITEKPPAKTVLNKALKKYEKVKQLINTSGGAYRDSDLKDRIKNMKNKEVIDELTANGRLIKRPVVTDNDRITVGFRDDFESTWS